MANSHVGRFYAKWFEENSVWEKEEIKQHIG